MTAASAPPTHTRPAVELRLVLRHADGTDTLATLGCVYPDPDIEAGEQVAQLLRGAADEFGSPLTPDADR